ncbi:phosphoglycolate phosphatase [Ruegeria sp. 2012CJ41-6]|uniref:Phosphoglycolate phosphatase n=1 Tax=Ruegeria spongiae TaxID=2942209 RepID=A0ABT0Q6G8_9RHOB|nr:phosphoglycolate phosphatase [Ruegeria spongiae]MCL6285464.1 phosphoglycolate phosphatase [Ruegeria spongiae]
MKPAIVFDLDGTLIDSVPDLAAAVNLTLTARGLPELDLTTIIGFVGNGLPKLVERVMTHGGVDMGLHSKLTRITLDNYMRAPTARTVLYAGVRDMLEAFTTSGNALGICTNKPEAAARQVLDALDLSRFFAVVVGGDTLAQRKPDPAPLLHVFEQLGAGPRFYVGDSEVDAETAQRAGVPFALFTEGYRKSPVASLPHQLAYADSGTLPALIADALTDPATR